MSVKGTAVALGKRFDITGMLGVLRLAARRGVVDLPDSFAQLKRANFRQRQEIINELLNQPEGG
jgi:predicted nucleic acid-binding protein